MYSTFDISIWRTSVSWQIPLQMMFLKCLVSNYYMIMMNHMQMCTFMYTFILDVFHSLNSRLSTKKAQI